jgi:hypothetical protein
MTNVQGKSNDQVPEKRTTDGHRWTRINFAQAAVAQSMEAGEAPGGAQAVRPVSTRMNIDENACLRPVNYPSGNRQGTRQGLDFTAKNAARRIRNQ